MIGEVFNSPAEHNMNIRSFDYRSHVSFNDEKACKVMLTETTHARTTLWCLKPGQHIHPHIHAGDHVWVIMEGEGLFLTDDQENLPVGQGTVLSATAGMSHGIENTGKTGLIFVSISAG
jgi:quercetin dioxygenase-like cupin family protein